MKNSSYRLDIQCLRGICVLAVILYHLPHSLLIGGYYGVDVFFIISGYVITLSILEEVKANHFFQIKNFILRRFRRLFPALLGVVAVTTFFIALIIPNYDSKDILKTGIHSLIGMSNIQLKSSSQSYFNISTQLNPFLHTWSLGIEEQFYFFFSIFVGIFFRKKITAQTQIDNQNKINSFLVALVGFATFSYFFFLKQILLKADISSAFYILTSRAWQLLLGAIGAALVFNRKNIQLSWQVKLLSTCTLFFVFIYADPIDIIRNPALEIFYRSLSSIAAFLLCIPSKPTFMQSKKLKPIFSSLLFLGDKSYSLYLVHWPIISLGYWFHSPWTSQSKYLLIIIFIASYFSWYFFESIASLKRKLILPITLLSLAALSVASNLYFPKWLNFQLISREKNKAWEETKLDYELSLNMKICSDDLKKMLPWSSCTNLDSSVKRRIFVVGDSHASHFLWGVDIFAKKTGFEVVHVPCRFPLSKIVLHVDRKGQLLSWIKAPSPKDSEEFVVPDSFSEAIKSDDIVIFAAYSSRVLGSMPQSITFPVDPYDNKIIPFPELPKKIERDFTKFISAVPLGAKIFFVLDTPILKAYPGTCLHNPKECSISFREVEEQRQKSTELYTSLSKKFSQIKILDLAPRLCGDTECTLLDSNGNYLYRDDNHLSPTGGRLFADLLSENYPSSKYIK